MSPDIRSCRDHKADAFAHTFPTRGRTTIRQATFQIFFQSENKCQSLRSERTLEYFYHDGESRRSLFPQH